MNLYSQAIRRFERLFRRAQRTELQEPTAAALATATPRGRPSVRIVLLKGVDERGFVFYTNMKSRKGRQLHANPQAALCFFWDPLMEQVLVEGRVKIVSKQEADQYWGTRPRMSQIGAWASLQSSPMKSPRVLLGRVAFYELKFAGKKIPRPPHWFGYRLVPNRIEFWVRRPFRLHERMLYEKKGQRWAKTLLYP